MLFILVTCFMVIILGHLFMKFGYTYTCGCTWRPIPDHWADTWQKWENQLDCWLFGFMVAVLFHLVKWRIQIR
jgi:hypothetical protein